MSLIPWRGKRGEIESREAGPMSSIERFRSELDRLFEGFFQEGLGGFDRLLSPITAWGPAVDISETEKEISVRVEVPGVDPNDLDLRVSGDVLVIAGEKKEESEENKKGYHHVERRFGSFHRTLRLPTEVDPEKVEAEFRNGVLTVRLGKTAKSVAKKIAIKNSGE